MSIKIITQNSPLATSIQKILTHYFHKQSPLPQPSPANKKTILIDTKYYTCQIPLTIQNFKWNHNKQNQQIAEKQTEEHEKVDGLIFVFEENEEVVQIRENIQRWVGKCEPQFVVVCVGGKDKDREWRYQADIAECDNFVPVIYEDFQIVSQQLPTWSPNSGLLKEEQKEEYQIFNLLEMLETTSWTNQIPKKVPLTKTTQKPEPNPQSTLTTAQNPQIKPALEQEQQQKQPTQQQLQKQMYEFELLMEQMMQVKAMPTNTVSHNDKKKKAQDVIMRLAKFMGQ